MGGSRICSAAKQVFKAQVVELQVGVDTTDDWLQYSL
jgi:hypothetical protein